MADLGKIQGLIGQYNAQLTTLKELFLADGKIDQEEQDQLDKIEGLINSLGDLLEDKIDSAQAEAGEDEEAGAPPAELESNQKTIKASVGRGGTNDKADVQLVQELLKAKGHNLAVDGLIGPGTIGEIKAFQQAAFGWADGRIDPGGQSWQALNGAASASSDDSSSSSDSSSATDSSEEGGVSGKDFSHPNAGNVSLSYGSKAVKLNSRAEKLLKSILAACGMTGATVTSTIRTYHDQARITMTQTLPGRGAKTVRKWYGQDVLDACRKYSGNIQAFADWWQKRDQNRGRVSSKHLSNQALDVVPNGNRSVFADKVAGLVPVSGSGVRRIIKKGQMNEPVDHVEFTFKVTG
ncbi:putative peptidoglycan binding protein [Saprospira grandis DSM 2844]|uniref:Putative peptidoglycan binding protein n=1 Tax=Saprospira grandis DSM 2844 TaxID=694433 RepID=J0P2J5_9BACT|nr:peptidoglycan-binding domain-containing protein [Saprospira grandis]EJF54024.1 putative peptidoglycan binding protein [Saprospira grandis DSM 2844]